MKDRQGREIDYIRISVTDRCNLRCRYCMPEDGIEQLSHGEILNFDEIIRLVKIFAGLGITKVKLTGGEPLVRKGFCRLVSDIKKVRGIQQVTMTTNGILLEENLPELIEAGIDGINISLDTLNADKYREITRHEGLEKVFSAIKACEMCEKLHVKINAVTLADYNIDEIEQLAAMAKDNCVDVRFIEIMPMGLGKNFEGYSREVILDRLERAYGKAEYSHENNGNGPAVYFRFEGFKGSVGFISAISHNFCGSCNRIRLTSEGFLKPCLNYSEGEDLREMMRTGMADTKLAAIIEKAIFNKPECHSFAQDTDIRKDSRKMSEIGG